MNEHLLLVFDLLKDTLLAGIGTLSFAVLFCVPKKHYAACAFNGAIAWFVYLICVNIGLTITVATLIATLVLTGISRAFAVVRKAPVTVFLFCGIFPLVPGAGLYYTAYYYIQGQNDLFASHANQTFLTAAALAIGISVVLALPLQKIVKVKK